MKSFLSAVVLISCLASCTVRPDTQDIEGTYSVIYTRSGGNCPSSIDTDTETETVAILNDDNDVLNVAFSSITGSCPVPYKNGTATLACIFTSKTNPTKQATLQGSWHFHGNGFNGTTTLAGNCDLVYATTGTKQ